MMKSRALLVKGWCFLIWGDKAARHLCVYDMPTGTGEKEVGWGDRARLAETPIVWGQSGLEKGGETMNQISLARSANPSVVCTQRSAILATAEGTKAVILNPYMNLSPRYGNHDVVSRRLRKDMVGFHA